MIFYKLLFIGTLISIACFDFSPGLNHNSWAMEPLGNSVVAYNNYLATQEAIADNAIISARSQFGFDMYITNGLIMFFLVSCLIIRSFFSKKIKNLTLATYILMFSVSFYYVMTTEWSCLMVPPWIFLLAMIGLLFCNSEYSLRQAGSLH